MVEAKYPDELAVQRPRAIGALHLDQDVETVRSDVAPLRRSKLGDSVIVVVVVVSVSAEATEPLQPGKETRFLGRSERHPARERRDVGTGLFERHAWNDGLRIQYRGAGKARAGRPQKLALQASPS